jgi:hypothetical protein
MEYRFSMTPRLLALAVICLFALMALMFMLGLTLGEREADSKHPSAISVDDIRSKRPTSSVSGPGPKPVNPEPATTAAPAPGAVKQ